MKIAYRIRFDKHTNSVGACPFAFFRKASRPHTPLSPNAPIRCVWLKHQKKKKGFKIKEVIKTLRLTKNEWEQIEIKLKESELNFTSFALASMLKQRAIKRKTSPINRDFITELAKWGNNLNQVAKHLNTKKNGLDRVGLEMLSRIEKHLQDLKKTIE